MADELVYFGGAIKDLGDGRVGGYLVRYGDEEQTDLEDEFFNQKTYYDKKDGERIPVIYHHGKDRTMGKRVLADGVLKYDDAGIWIEAQLDLHDRYVDMLYRRGIMQGKMGWSAGAVGHLIERENVGKATWIKSWPIGEASITPIPAEPRNVALPLKSLETTEMVDELTEAEEEPEAPPETPAGVASVAEPDASVKSNLQVIHNEEGNNMPTENGTPPADERVEALENQVKNLSDNVTRLLEVLENEPAANDAGIVSDTGGTSDPQIKSFADFLLSINRGDTKRLHEVYHSTKDLGTTDGSQGGYLVPDEYSAQLLQVANEGSPILSRVQTIPVGSKAGTYPALDQYITPTAGSGQTAMAAGVKATTTAEGATLTETEPGFVELNWQVKKNGGYTEVSNELIADSPQAIEVLLRQLFALSIAAKKEFMLLRGNGSTQWLGILNSPAAIGISPDTNSVFAYEDALEMRSRFKIISQNVAWLAHPGMIPDIGVFEIGTSGAAVPQGVGTAGGLMTMPGSPYPIIYTEHLPQDDNAGCVILADLNAYLQFQRGTLSIAYSEHAAFTSDKGTWRFTDRSDGMPWVKNTITLADPQGSYTVSPFVYFND